MADPTSSRSSRGSVTGDLARTQLFLNRDPPTRARQYPRTREEAVSPSRVARPLFGGGTSAVSAGIVNGRGRVGANGSHGRLRPRYQSGEGNGSENGGTPHRPLSAYAGKVQQARADVGRVREALSAHRRSGTDTTTTRMSFPGGGAVMLAQTQAGAGALQVPVPTQHESLRHQSQNLIGALEEWQSASVQVAHVNDRLVTEG